MKQYAIYINTRWCHPVYKGVTQACSEISERPLFSTFKDNLGKITPISGKNKDNFEFKNTPFLPTQGYFSKNLPYFLKKSEKNMKTLGPLWHKNVNGFLKYTLFFHFEDSILYKKSPYF